MAIGWIILAAAGGAGYVAARYWMRRGGGNSAPALKVERAEGFVGETGNVRPAGTEAMRDPPAEWDQVDEASDGSFPASDPPNLTQKVD